jgi:putative inorganic carbon (HCO3(-)) transporter
VLYEKKPIMKILAGWALAASFLTVVLTFSRGGFLAMCGVVVLILLMRKPPLVVVLCGVLIVLVLIPFLPGAYFERIQTILEYLPFTGKDVRTEVSLRGRASEYAVGLEMFLERPILGIGYENYAANYLKYSMKIGLDPRRTERSAHSLYLQVLAEQGILGMLMFGFVLYSTFKSLARSKEIFHRISYDGYADLAMAFQIGFIGYLAAALFIHGAYPRNLWLLIGVGLAAQQTARNEEVQTARRLFRQRLRINEAAMIHSAGKN